MILAVDLNENVLLVVVVFRGVAVDFHGYITSRRKGVLDVLLARLLRLMRLRRLRRRHLQAYVLVQRGLWQDGLEGLSGTRPGQLRRILGYFVVPDKRSMVLSLRRVREQRMVLGSRTGMGLREVLGERRLPAAPGAARGGPVLCRCRAFERMREQGRSCRRHTGDGDATADNLLKWLGQRKT